MWSRYEKRVILHRYEVKRSNDHTVGFFASAGEGKEEMGHIKGSLGHGGWYLTQIHIFHSDGRGTWRGGRGRVRIVSVWVVGLPEHAKRVGGAARNDKVDRGRREWAVCMSVYMSVCKLLQVWARVEWVGIRVDRTGLVRFCRRVVVHWYAGVWGAGTFPHTFRSLARYPRIARSSHVGRGSIAMLAVGCTVRARTPTK